MAERAPPARVDVPTLIAVAIVAYAITNVAHEGLGHGGACLLVGGAPIELNAVYFDCDKGGLTPAAARWISSGGTLVNLVMGALTWLALRRTGAAPTPGRYFLWLLMTLSFLQATGYWLFSGIGGIGDWAKVIEGMGPPIALRAGLTVLGGAGYYLSIRLALGMLRPMLGPAEGRLALARKLMVVPYLAGGILYVVAGLLNPIGLFLVLISAMAASFGGASALAWMYQLLRDMKAYPPEEGPALTLERSRSWLVAGAVTAAIFVLVLGRSVTLGPR